MRTQLDDYRNGVRAAVLLCGLCVPAALTGCLAATKIHRWESALHRDAVQVLDGATATLTLRDGDVLVTSTEGVARAYEVELGASVSAGHPMTLSRLPQVEDYSSGG